MMTTRIALMAAMVLLAGNSGYDVAAPSGDIIEPLDESREAEEAQWQRHPPIFFV